jgi:hypothetical protein
VQIKESLNKIRNILSSSENKDLASAYEYMCLHIEKQLDRGERDRALANARHLLKDVYLDAKEGYLQLIPELTKIALHE